jgi:hypothetical protein
MDEPASLPAGLITTMGEFLFARRGAAAILRRRFRGL